MLPFRINDIGWSNLAFLFSLGRTDEIQRTRTSIMLLWYLLWFCRNEIWTVFALGLRIELIRFHYLYFSYVWTIWIVVSSNHILSISELMKVIYCFEQIYKWLLGENWVITEAVHLFQFKLYCTSWATNWHELQTKTICCRSWKSSQRSNEKVFVLIEMSQSSRNGIS